MPEHIRALIVILVLSTLVFAIARRPAYVVTRQRDYIRRRNIWFLITLIAFLAHNFWVYVFLAGLVLAISLKREPNKCALFFILLFCVPALTRQVPGFGIVNYFLDLSHQRLLILVILMPAFLVLAGKANTVSFGRLLPDKILALYLLLTVILYSRDVSITDTLRQVVYQFIDVFLPYFVISRSLDKISKMREAMLSFLLAVMILAAIASFEILRHWLLYQALEDAMGLKSRFSGYGARSGLLRASASVGQIPLGYLMAIGIGFFLYLKRFISSTLLRNLGILLLLAGLVAPVSRGPWVGALFLITVFILTGRQVTLHLSKLLLAGVLGLLLLSVSPVGERVMNLIPYYGETERGNITYRETLIENSLIVIMRHPLFGSTNYLQTREMESMRQGQGIIDIVNTYLGIALEKGLVGVGLFIGFFASICWGIFRSFRRLPGANYEEWILGRSLLASLCGILLIIFTVSSVSIIPIVYWSVAGMGVAYMNSLDRSKQARAIEAHA